MREKAPVSPSKSSVTIPWPNKILVAFTVVILAFTALAFGGCPEALSTISILVKGHGLIVEVAGTPADRQCGLSQRKSLPEGRGMLFVFPTSKPLSFWMKDTYVPLSIAFLDEKGIIVGIEKMEPLQVTKRYRSPCPARYALEVQQGWFEIHGVHVGDTAHIRIPEGFNIY
jgi:uncharacterized membrane protein (UPF0127 family)